MKWVYRLATVLGFIGAAGAVAYYVVAVWRVINYLFG